MNGAAEGVRRPMGEKKAMTRREFVKEAAFAGAGLTIVPRHVLGKGVTPPSDLLNIAAVGVGGRGRTNLINLASQNIVAMCDVDWGYAEKGFAQLDNAIAGLSTRIAAPDPEQQPGKPLIVFDREQAKARLAGMQRLKDVHLPKAKRYNDYRGMLEKQKEIEGVLIATPDHMHAPIALAAMELGKHVYVQKPLTWCVAEARQLAKRARESKVATQMGNQGHSLDDARKAVDYVWAGAIGEVREVHIWTNRPGGIWPQGVTGPAEAGQPVGELRWNGSGVNTRIAAAMAEGSYPIPEKLNWDLFLA